VLTFDIDYATIETPLMKGTRMSTAKAPGSDRTSVLARMREAWDSRPMDAPYPARRRRAAAVALSTALVLGGSISAANGGVMGETRTECVAVGDHRTGMEALLGLGVPLSTIDQIDSNRRAGEFGARAMACMTTRNILWPLGLGGSYVAPVEELPADAIIKG